MSDQQRTLVIGIPLPHLTYDNYSFLSAPSFFDYRRMIVEAAAVSQVVEEVVAGSAEHRTFGGQRVTNGPSSARAMGLADLLLLRRREMERFLDRGGMAVVFAYPDAPHTGIQGLSGWRRYSWLPSPEGFRYDEHLVPGFGRPGVRLEEVGHPFAPYIEAFGPRLAYRAYADEEAPSFGEYARVFARSVGGAAVGVELRVGRGRIVFIPPLERLDPSRDRTVLAERLYQCLERATDYSSGEAPEWMRKEVS